MREWLQDCESRSDLFRLLHDNAHGPLAILELGVAEGRLSEEILQSCPEARVHLVDPWANLPLEEWRDGGNFDQATMSAQYQSVLDRLQKYGNRVATYRMRGAEALPRFNDRSLDVVYIDANHAYKHVCDDIAMWWPKIKPGGILAGHDWTENPNKHVVGVIPAVTEFVQREKLPLHLLNKTTDCSWAVRKPL